MSDDDTTGGEIIDLPTQPVDIRPKADLPFRLIVNRSGPYCSHQTKEVDHYRRTVTCTQKGCGAVLDAFDVLNDFAAEYEGFEKHYQRVKADIKAAEARIELLKRLENNARSRAKRLGVSGSRYEHDSLLHYARRVLNRDVKADELDVMLSNSPPDVRISQALKAIDTGHVHAGLALLRRAVEELEASVDVVEEERKHG